MGGRGKVIRFRYITAALAGRWRDTEAAAIEDAVRLGLAHWVEGELVWRVAARIEPDEGGWPAWPRAGFE